MAKTKNYEIMLVACKKEASRVKCLGNQKLKVYKEMAVNAKSFSTTRELVNRVLELENLLRDLQYATPKIVEEFGNMSYFIDTAKRIEEF